jgi:hypothetical protein
MKKMILTPTISVVILLVATCGFAQDYDLIVTTKGDSIACRIDSITETHIYFEMKSQNKWAQTHIGLTDVSEYKRKAINRSEYLFKPGTTIIEAAYTGYLLRNSVYVGIMSINYSRTIAGNPVGITFGGGLSYFDALGLLVESTLLKGRGKHFFEPGIMGVYSPASYGVFIRAGYRYQGPKGFLFRSALLLGYLYTDFDDPYVVNLLPALSIGYSF